MKAKRLLKDSLLSLLVISLTAGAYAAISSVNTWTPLTASMWNDMKATVDGNTSKLTGITNTNWAIYSKWWASKTTDTASTIAQFWSNDTTDPLAFKLTSRTWKWTSNYVALDVSEWTSARDFIIGYSTGERMRIDANGNVGIWTTPPAGASSSSYKQLFLNSGWALSDSGWSGPATFLMNNSYVGSGNNNYYTQSQKASAYLQTVGKHEFKVAQSWTADNQISWNTPMIIENDWNVRFWDAYAYPPTWELTRINKWLIQVMRNWTTNRQYVQFMNGNGSVGGIWTSGSSTAYNTSSDYRLKENVVPMSDAVARVNALKPVRFNFKSDKNETVDWFIAHEVQEIVPEAVSGEKDWVDAEGNPEYQAMDYAKVTPLLTAALQEALKEIELLKKEIEILKNK